MYVAISVFWASVSWLNFVTVTSMSSFSKSTKTTTLPRTYSSTSFFSFLLISFLFLVYSSHIRASFTAPGIAVSRVSSDQCLMYTYVISFPIVHSSHIKASFTSPGIVLHWSMYYVRSILTYVISFPIVHSSHIRASFSAPGIAVHWSMYSYTYVIPLPIVHSSHIRASFTAPGIAVHRVNRVSNDRCLMGYSHMLSLSLLCSRPFVTQYNSGLQIQ